MFKLARDIIVIVASLCISVFVINSFVKANELKEKEEKEKLNAANCTNPSVESLLLKVTTADLVKDLKSKDIILVPSVVRENTSTEEKKPTIDNKAKYTCSTSISIKVSPSDTDIGRSNFKILTQGTELFNNTYTKEYNRTFTVLENDLGTTFSLSSEKIRNVSYF